jgi:6-phosphogluconolactonase
VFIFWADERCVLLNDERNNAQMAKNILLNKIKIPASNIYRIPSDIDPSKVARIYEDNIRFFFKGHFPSFDIILLGLGENGHTASLFPYTEALHDASHLVAKVYVKEQDMYRITMTSFLINMAHNILFLVSGPGKAEIVNQILNGTSDPERYPAQLINPLSGELYWYLDKEAAEKL